MQVYICKRSKKVASQLSNYPRTKGCAWEKLDLSMKNKIVPIGYGDDLKYEEKGFMKFRFRKPSGQTSILEGTGVCLW